MNLTIDGRQTWLSPKRAAELILIAREIDAVRLDAVRQGRDGYPFTNPVFRRLTELLDDGLRKEMRQ
jgi:hypothetical protein